MPMLNAFSNKTRSRHVSQAGDACFIYLPMDIVVVMKGGVGVAMTLGVMLPSWRGVAGSTHCPSSVLPTDSSYIQY